MDTDTSEPTIPPLSRAQRRNMHLATARQYARRARRYGKKTAEYAEAMKIHDAHLERAESLK